MKVERISYRAAERTLIGALVYDDAASAKRPLMLMAPNWLGVTSDAIERTKQLVGAGHVGFVADMYGAGKTAEGPAEAAELANGLRADPKERRQRIGAALKALIFEAAKRGIADTTRVSAVGFCFGGGTPYPIGTSRCSGLPTGTASDVRTSRSARGLTSTDGGWTRRRRKLWQTTEASKRVSFP